MATIQGAIDEIISDLAAIDGINLAPSDPVETVPIFPAAIVYTTDGTVSTTKASLWDHSLHNVAIAVIMPLNDYAYCMQTMLALYEPIIAAILTRQQVTKSSHFSTFGNIDYTLGVIDWPQGQEMFGYIFVIREMKIQNAIT